MFMLRVGTEYRVPRSQLKKPMEVPVPHGRRTESLSGQWRSYKCQSPELTSRSSKDLAEPFLAARVSSTPRPTRILAGIHTYLDM